MNAVLRERIELEKRTALNAAVGGSRAIVDCLEALGARPGGKPIHADVIVHDNHFDVTTHTEDGDEERFLVPKDLFKISHQASWEEALELIHTLEPLLSPPGLGHNADEKLTRLVIEEVRSYTGYDVRLGDFWVHVGACRERSEEEKLKNPWVGGPHGTQEVTFGPLTRAGSLAMAKLTAGLESGIGFGLPSRGSGSQTSPEAGQLEAVKAILQEWLNSQGHSRCHYHPEVLQKLCNVVGIAATLPVIRPTREEFKAGCDRYTEEEYGSGI